MDPVDAPSSVCECKQISIVSLSKCARRPHSSSGGLFIARWSGHLRGFKHCTYLICLQLQVDVTVGHLQQRFTITHDWRILYFIVILH